MSCCDFHLDKRIVFIRFKMSRIICFIKRSLNCFREFCPTSLEWSLWGITKKMKTKLLIIIIMEKKNHPFHFVVVDNFVSDIQTNTRACLAFNFLHVTICMLVSNWHKSEEELRRAERTALYPNCTRSTDVTLYDWERPVTLIPTDNQWSEKGCNKRVFKSRQNVFYLSPIPFSNGFSLSSLMIPVPPISNEAKAFLIMSSGSVPLSFSPINVRNMVKFRGPDASPNISSM